VTTLQLGAIGVSPAFAVSAEEFTLYWVTGLTRVAIDGVEPPTLGADGGTTAAFGLVNRWSPWCDEKLIEPKYEGVCQHLGVPSNRPTPIKDYQVIALMRAVDYLLSPRYWGLIQVAAGSPVPLPPPVG